MTIIASNSFHKRDLAMAETKLARDDIAQALGLTNSVGLVDARVRGETCFDDGVLLSTTVIKEICRLLKNLPPQQVQPVQRAGCIYTEEDMEILLQAERDYIANYLSDMSSDKSLTTEEQKLLEAVSEEISLGNYPVDEQDDRRGGPALPQQEVVDPTDALPNDISYLGWD